jgi:di/tricarboxylate transporter
MLAIRKSQGLDLNPVARYAPDAPGDVADSPAAGDGAAGADAAPEQLVQAVVAPESDLVGRSIADIDFRQRYGAIVVGLWRRQGWLQQELSRIRLQAGDVLVLLGDEESLARVGRDPAFLMLVPFQGEPRMRRMASVAGAIMLGTILLAALNIFTIEMAALAGAIAAVLSGCLTPRQAYRSVDTRIFVFIAGAIPLGVAMQKTGTADLLARGLQALVSGWNETVVLLLLFFIVAVITQFMSDSATTAIFAPVAVALAQALGRLPEPYVVTVAMASVAAFLTPIGHHGNLLVYGPGRYRFSDFVKVGTPLTVIVAVIVALLAPIVWHA